MCQIDELNKVSESVNNLQETIKKLSSNLSGMKDDSKDKIYLQLHEQYAINNNANLSSVITIIVAAIAQFHIFVADLRQFHQEKLLMKQNNLSKMVSEN